MKIIPNFKRENYKPLSEEHVNMLSLKEGEELICLDNHVERAGTIVRFDKFDPDYYKTLPDLLYIKGYPDDGFFVFRFARNKKIKLKLG